tara:strand:- start:2841 stop:3194 length:354 start_codon:yes stop_codon:yes gene_type:complete
MDDLDEGLIKLVNHKDHPTNKAYRVYFFYKKQEAEYFKTLLVKENIQFEYADEPNKRGEIFLFGIRKNDNQKVLNLNYQTIGKFRSPFISQSWAQYALIILSFLIVIFAVISFYKNK